MANHPSALKRQRQSEKRRDHNRTIKKRLRVLQKKLKTLESKKEGLIALHQTVSVIHKAAQKGVLKESAANRKISQLSKFVNKLT